MARSPSSSPSSPPWRACCHPGGPRVSIPWSPCELISPRRLTNSHSGRGGRIGRMTRKPAFWIFLTVLCLASAAFSRRYFTRAFPLLSVDIRMDRQGALAEARRLAADQQLGPPEFTSAASFSVDDAVQTFVELEGGGKPAFSALVADRQFTPYRWRVRHFKEREPREAAFSFAPDGTPDGFDEKLKEDAPGAALREEAARRIAESTARRVWHVELEPFQAVEHSQEQRIGGRVDHTFVYERPDRRLGE